MTAAELGHWGLLAVQVVVCAVLGLMGVAAVLYTGYALFVHATGRRTRDGRRRLNLVAETRAATRMALDERGECASRRMVVSGKRVTARISRDHVSPLTTPMAREIAAWHGLEHVHRPMDTGIGTYPVLFRRPTGDGR